MTRVDQVRDDSPASKRGRPRFLWAFALLAAVFFLIGFGGLSFQGKLSDVQKNDNSSFLPSSADSTKVNNAAEKFNDVQTIPGFIVYQRSGGLTAEDKADILPNLFDLVKVNGKLYAWPLWVPPVGMYMNLDIFQENIVDLPPKTWTYDDFVALPTNLTSPPRRDQVYGLPALADDDDLPLRAVPSVAVGTHVRRCAVDAFKAR